MPHLLYGGRQRLGGENYPDTDAPLFPNRKSRNFQCGNITCRWQDSTPKSALFPPGDRASGDLPIVNAIGVAPVLFQRL
jgi:hypothetical protein